MKKSTAIFLVITIAAAICAIGLANYKNKRSIINLTAKQIQSVTLFHERENNGNIYKEYNYNQATPDDMKVINNIVKDLNKSKTVDVLDEQAVFNGGPPGYWEMLLTDGESLRIYVIRFQQGYRILVSMSNSNKTYVSDSPEIIKLMSDEYKRIYNENVP